jgi:hypothetical protein
LVRLFQGVFRVKHAVILADALNFER